MLKNLAEVIDPVSRLRGPLSPLAPVSWRHSALQLILSFCLPAVALASQVSVGTATENCYKVANDASQITCYAASPTGSSGYAEAQAGSGELHAEALADYSFPAGSYYTPLSGGATAVADYLDTLSLTNAPDQGFLLFAFHIDGSISFETTVGGDAYAAVNIVAGTNSYAVWSGNQGVGGLFSVEVPYTGSEITMDFQLINEASCGTGGGSALDPLGMCQASVEFQDTASIVGLGVLDQNGNAVPNASVTASSGYSYPGLSTVPEPSRLPFISIAMAAMLASLRTRKRARS